MRQKEEGVRGAAMCPGNDCFSGSSTFLNPCRRVQKAQYHRHRKIQIQTIMRNCILSIREHFFIINILHVGDSVKKLTLS